MDMTNLLIFGRTGQVAQGLARLALGARFVGRDEADLTDPAACAALIARERPAAVINAAYTAVDRAETDTETARLVNAEALGAMAAACARAGIPFLLSRPTTFLTARGEDLRAEDAPTRPLGVYGHQAGRRAHHRGRRRAMGGDADLLGLLGAWDELREDDAAPGCGTRSADDRRRPVSGPTPAAEIASALLTMARAMVADPGKGGLYHFAGAPDVSWADFAREIFARSGLSPEVVDIPTSAYPTPARRPLNSRLDCRAITRDFGIAPPDWRAGLDRVIEELSA